MTTESQKELKDFGWANGWGGNTPALVEECRSKNHVRESKDIGLCAHEVWCRQCGYKYKYDSSG